MIQLPVFIFKALINLWPPLLFTGIKLVYAAKTWRYLRVEMPLRFYNKNSHGIHFGGSLYSMTDPWYLIMLSQNLGKEYFVIDQSAHIAYEKPGLGRVYAEFFLNEEILADIIQQAEDGQKVIKTFPIQIKNDQNDIICTVEKTVYIRKQRQESNS